MHLKRAIPLVVASATTVLSIATPAFAFTDSMYPTNNLAYNCVDADFGGNFCQTDNRTLRVFFQSSVSAAVETTVRGRLNGTYEDTVLNVSYDSVGVYSGDSETDIVYQVSATGFAGSYIGMTWCNDAVTGTPVSFSCDQHYVRFKAASYVDAELACHETGHAVGLTHGEDASPKVTSSNGATMRCMETPDTSNHPSLGPDLQGEINATYN